MRTNYDYKTVATIISNRLFSTRDDVFALLSHMTGCAVMGPHYDAVRSACAAYFYNKFPELGAIDFTDCSEHNYLPFLDETRLVLGDMVEVEACCVTQADKRYTCALTT